MRSIHESDTNWFDKDESATDIDGSEMCPVRGCCSLVEAEVTVGSIFEQADQFPVDSQSGDWFALAAAKRIGDTPD